MHPQRLPGESERGIVDIETLKQTNQELIATLDDVMNIQKEGAAPREPRQNWKCARWKKT